MFWFQITEQITQQTTEQINEQSNIVVCEDYTSYATYRLGGITYSKVEPKKTTKKNDNGADVEITYYVIPIKYLYRNGEFSRLDQLYIEGPELTTKLGIMERQNPMRNELDYSIMVMFDMLNQDHKLFVDKMDELHLDCIDLFIKNKTDLPADCKQTLSKVEIAKAVVKHPIYYPKDDNDKLIEGKSPSCFFKLFKRQNDNGRVYKTVFVDPNGEDIPWEYLIGTEFKFIPLIHVRRLMCVSCKLIITIEMTSAIVTAVSAKKDKIRNMATLNSLKSRNPNIVDAVKSQIAIINNMKQDELIHKNHNEHRENQNQSTFENVIPIPNQNYESNLHIPNQMYESNTSMEMQNQVYVSNTPMSNYHYNEQTNSNDEHNNEYDENDYHEQPQQQSFIDPIPQSPQVVSQSAKIPNLSGIPNIPNLNLPKPPLTMGSFAKQAPMNTPKQVPMNQLRRM